MNYKIMNDEVRNCVRANRHLYSMAYICRETNLNYRTITDWNQERNDILNYEALQTLYDYLREQIPILLAKNVGQENVDNRFIFTKEDYQFLLNYRPVIKYNAQHEFIEKYQSLCAGARSVGVSHRFLKEAIVRNAMVNGFYFEFANE